MRIIAEYNTKVYVYMDTNAKTISEIHVDDEQIEFTCVRAIDTIEGGECVGKKIKDKKIKTQALAIYERPSDEDWPAWQFGW